MKEANIMIDFTFTVNKQPEEKTNKQTKRNRFQINQQNMEEKQTKGI